ncbi:hypothetical protein ACIHCQ_17650 [Streptomyces sp. NPDC052236]|uniref:hypothetical protein n=1 Tax=Streptomyces sp. NPDC052236 TaxID=3365686 RepID=UPI0037D6E67E
MELRARLLRLATSRPGVLLAVCPGATRARLAVERELGRRGWRYAAAPASANLLVVVGAPDPAGAEWIDGLWRGIPAPKARVDVREASGVAAALDEGRAALLVPPMAHDHASHGESSGDHMQDMHGVDGMHDMQDMHIAGLAMADRADDRDGLRLDRLHVPLGPALPDWPAGLVLRLALQGDVVQRATVEHIPVPASTAAMSSASVPYWNEPWLRASTGESVSGAAAARRLCAAHLDSLGRFFAVVGWQDAATRARAARDEAVDGRSSGEILALVRPLARRAQRSRTLRWLAAGLGELSSDRATAAGVSGPALVADGDAYDRVLVWLDRAGHAAASCDDGSGIGAPATEPTGPRGRVDGAAPPSRALLGVLPGLLEGAEFACARIIVASLDPDLDELHG